MFILSTDGYASLAKYVELVEGAQYTPLALRLAAAESEEFVRSNAQELFGGDQEKLEDALRKCGDDFSFRCRAVRTFYDNLTLGRGIHAWVDLTLRDEPYSSSSKLSMNFVDGPLERRRIIELTENEKKTIYPLEEEYIFLSGIVLPIMADSKNHAAKRLLSIARDRGLDPYIAASDKEIRELAIEGGMEGYRRKDIERTTRWVNEGLLALDTDLLPSINERSLEYLRSHIQQLVPDEVLVTATSEPRPSPRSESDSRLRAASARESEEMASRSGHV